MLLGLVTNACSLGGVSNVLALRDLHDQEVANLNTVLRRELQELSSEDLALLEARDPIFGKIFGGVKKVLGFRDIEARDVEELELSARDIEYLEARDPIFGKIFGGVKKVLGFRDLHTRGLELLGQDIAELDVRDLEILEARNPIFGKIFGGVKKVLGFRDLHTRDLDEINNYLEAREASGLSGRNAEALFPLAILSKIAKPVIKGVGGAIGGGSSNQNRQRRDINEMSDYLEVREADPLVPLAPASKPAIRSLAGVGWAIAHNRRQRREVGLEAREWEDPETFVF